MLPHPSALKGARIPRDIFDQKKLLVQEWAGVDAVEAVADLEVQEGVIAAAQFRDILTACDAVTLFDRDIGDVGIDCEQVTCVADHDNRDAVRAFGYCGDSTCIGGFYRRARCCFDVDALVFAFGVFTDDGAVHGADEFARGGGFCGFSYICDGF